MTYGIRFPAAGAELCSTPRSRDDGCSAASCKTASKKAKDHGHERTNQSKVARSKAEQAACLLVADTVGTPKGTDARCLAIVLGRRREKRPVSLAHRVNCCAGDGHVDEAGDSRLLHSAHQTGGRQRCCLLGAVQEAQRRSTNSPTRTDAHHARARCNATALNNPRQVRGLVLPGQNARPPAIAAGL